MTQKVSYESFDWNQLSNYCQFKPSLKTAAEMMGCCETTLKSYIRRKFDESYSEFQDRKMSPVKIKLVQKALQMALGGDRVMLIFCLKNLCKWSDNPLPEQEQMAELDFIEV
jgi:hypothetical protein